MKTELSAYLPVFVDESREILQRMGENLLKLEKNHFAESREKLETLWEVYRGMHTLKGMAATIEISPMAQLAHELESLLDEACHEREEVSGILQRLFLGVDALGQLVENLGNENPVKASPPDSPEKPVRAPSPSARKASATVRVSVERLDRLLDLVSELMIDRSRLGTLSPPEHGEFDEVLGHLGGVASSLQSVALALRMVPIENAFHRFPRLVRDMSRSLGKEISLTLEGKDTEMDRRIIDEMGVPLMHLVRNAVDHALELPEERLEKGKTREGHLRLSARCEGELVRLEVSDDGRGIDPGALRARAVACGLLSPEHAGSLSAQQAIDLIFLPGFSTREMVNSLSGRGMGLDIVCSRLRALGGAIEVSTVIGEGTTFTLSFPCLGGAPILEEGCP